MTPAEFVTTFTRASQRCEVFRALQRRLEHRVNRAAPIAQRLASMVPGTALTFNQVLVLRASGTTGKAEGCWDFGRTGEEVIGGCGCDGAVSAALVVVALLEELETEKKLGGQDEQAR